MPKNEETIKKLRESLAADRAKLAGATAQAFEAAKPANIARNSADQVKNFAKTEFQTAIGQFREEDGRLKLNRLLMIGGAVLGVVVLAVSVNSIANRRTLSAAQLRKELTR